jgi:hypothetical protein
LLARLFASTAMCVVTGVKALGYDQGEVKENQDIR